MRLNLTAPINQLGYGVVGTNIVTALTGDDHDVALWPIGNVECDAYRQPIIELAVQARSIYSTGVPSVRLWHQNDLAMHPSSPRCGFPIFELTQFSEVELHQLKNLDAVFAASQWGVDVLKSNGVERSFKVPFGVDHSVFFPLPAATTADAPTVFLTAGKWEYRKGHDLLSTAFESAFTPADNVLLVLHCHNPFLSPQETADWERSFKESPMGKKVVITPGRFKHQDQLANLMRQADCGVFIARAEGWNMELAEMMAMGKQVIATNYSAHTEYCTDDNAMLINIERREAAYDGKFFTGGVGEWANLGEDQLEQTVEYMRLVHHKKQSGELTTNKNGIKTFERLTWANTAKELVQCLSMFVNS